VSVITAHKILIASAIGFFLVYALWELAHYAESGDARALLWSAAAASGAVGLAAYLRHFIRSLRRSSPC
jgi:hypothetical protein